MLGIVAQLNKDKLKHDDKVNKKHGLEDDEITMLEKYLVTQEIRAKQLAEHLEREEASYSTVARSKLERKLKQGVSGQVAQKHENDLKSSTTKKEAKVLSLKEKIKVLETQKESFARTIDAKIEKLENDVTREEEAIEMTEKYFRPLIERCYEERPLDVTFPTSYYKKQQELKDCQAQITSLKTNIQAMKVANFDNKPRLEKWDKLEEGLRKMREQSRREAMAAEQERIAKEEEANKLILEQKKAEREARDRRDEERWESQRMAKELLEREFGRE